MPALVVPYATPEEDEQLRRARRLEELGALRVLAPERLEPARLAREIARLPEFEPTRPAIDLDGGRGTCRELWALIQGGLQPALLSTGSEPVSPAARALRPYVRRQWKALAGAGGATGVLTAADLAKPWPLAIVVDQLLGRTAPFTLDGGDWRMLLAVAGLVLVIALAEAAATYFSNLWLQTAGERISHELRIAVYDHLQALSLAFHQRRQKGDLLTRVTGDVNAMGELFAQSLGAITQAALLAFGMTVVLLVIDPVLALVSLATTPALAGISFLYRRRVRTTAKVRRAHEGRIASIAGEALSAMPVVKAFGSERLEADRVRAGSEQRMAVGVEVARLQAGFDGLVGSVRAISTALVLVIGVLRVSAGALSPGELLVFVSYTRRAYSPLKSLARESTKVAATMAKADRIAEILAADDVLEERPGAYRGGRAAGAIELDGVSFAYEGERPVLRDLSLRIPAGSRVAIVGESGIGKSTLAALIARFHDPTGGRVLIDGRDARDCSLDVAALAGRDPAPGHRAVQRLGARQHRVRLRRERRARSSTRPARPRRTSSSARCRRATTPSSGPQGAGLSGGQRQRIGIARTLLRDPPILLLDEPTTALDAGSEAQLLDGLRRLMEGRTTLLITHSPRLEAMADRVIRLDGGRAARPRDRPPAAAARAAARSRGDGGRARAHARAGRRARARRGRARGLQAARAGRRPLPHRDRRCGGDQHRRRRPRGERAAPALRRARAADQRPLAGAEPARLRRRAGGGGDVAAVRPAAAGARRDRRRAGARGSMARRRSRARADRLQAARRAPCCGSDRWC